MPIPKFSDWSRLDEAKGDAIVVVKSDSMWSKINDMVVCLFPGRTSREDAKRKTLELMKAKWGELPYRDQDVLRDMNVYQVPMTTLVGDGIGMPVLESEAVLESRSLPTGARALADALRANGVPVMSHQEGDDEVDGEVKITDKVHVQVGPGYVTVNRIVGDLKKGGGIMIGEEQPRDMKHLVRMINAAISTSKSADRRGKVEESSSGETFDYMMLSRLQSDCEYYLGHGGRSPHILHQGDEKKQIAEMKRIWKKLKVKPEWLSMEDIKDYEKKMVG